MAKGATDDTRKKTQLHIRPWWSSWSMMSVCESQDEEISSWAKQVGQELEMISSWSYSRPEQTA